MFPEVFIIESLYKEDLEEGRLEGDLISKILRMGGRRPEYYFVKSREQLVARIEQFATSQYRYLHLSCHGSANSFHFYFGSMNFEEFTALVRNKLANRRIFVSACETVNEYLANLLIPSSKCYSLIGPYELIDLDDAAIIWASYYYLAFKGDRTAMNRKLILKTLSSLTKLYRINLNYYSISKRKGIKLKHFSGKK